MGKELVTAGDIASGEVGWDLLHLFRRSDTNTKLTTGPEIARALTASEIADWIEGRRGNIAHKQSGVAALRSMQERANAGDQDAAIAAGMIEHFRQNPVRPPAYIYRNAFRRASLAVAQAKTQNEAAYNYAKFVKSYNEAVAGKDVTLANLYAERLAQIRSQFGDNIGQLAVQRGFISPTDTNTFAANVSAASKPGVAGMFGALCGADTYSKGL
jgi:hypothetical protein